MAILDIFMLWIIGIAHIDLILMNIGVTALLGKLGTAAYILDPYLSLMFP